eukprot:5730621-Amphidinium_carterae.3
MKPIQRDSFIPGQWEDNRATTQFQRARRGQCAPPSPVPESTGPLPRYGNPLSLEQSRQDTIRQQQANRFDGMETSSGSNSESSNGQWDVQCVNLFLTC